MLINKWLVVDSLVPDSRDLQTGLCLRITKEPNEMSSFLKSLQEKPVEIPFTILLSGSNLDEKKQSDSYIEKIISLLFQPSYYLANYQPLLFGDNETRANSDFISTLVQKSKNQGFQDIIVLEPTNLNDFDVAINQHAYAITSINNNYDLVVKNWITQYLENKNPTEIHLLISEKEHNALALLNGIEKKLCALPEYNTAVTLYKQQQLIDEQKHLLELKAAREKDFDLYLNLQRQETADNIKWYHDEYEILPLWYKRFGHILKVLMGKRTLRSLFNDKVKKQKD